MTRRVDRSDRAVADALRAAGSEQPFDGSLDDLAARIDAVAAPLLVARRLGQRSLLWWDFAAEWARMLIPAGLTIAAASVMLLWVMRPVSPPIVAGRRVAPAADVIDRAVDDLMGSRAAPPAPRKP